MSVSAKIDIKTLIQTMSENDITILMFELEHRVQTDDELYKSKLQKNIMTFVEQQVAEIIDSMLIIKSDFPNRTIKMNAKLGKMIVTNINSRNLGLMAKCVEYRHKGECVVVNYDDTLINLNE